MSRLIRGCLVSNQIRLFPVLFPGFCLSLFLPLSPSLSLRVPSLSELIAKTETLLRVELREWPTLGHSIGATSKNFQHAKLEDIGEIKIQAFINLSEILRIACMDNVRDTVYRESDRIIVQADKHCQKIQKKFT